ncbi:hypothetical protein, partial [Pseudophaeobacter sp. C1-32P7]|uniref:hypothetical protein n=1 Tax=Pseudophaeobacter sp. C1-32P7 TaxID=3098142 RepID=UPI0034D5C000
KQKEVQMDDRSTSQTQDTAQQKQGGCCGGKTDAQPKANVEPQIAEPAKAKPAKSGCCCG